MTSIATETMANIVSPEMVFVHACERNENVEVARYLQRSSVFARLVAACALVPAAPMIGMLVVLIRLTSKGPGIFRQKRVGLNGTPYMMYKLRTMRCDAETKSGPQWSVKNDCRVTRLGRFLRSSHLDELPQLVNVLRGDMRFVGPRPERPEFVSVLEESLPGYCERLRVLPGITGLAQVNLPPDSNLDSVRDKLDLDVEYIRTANALLDMRIIVCTLLKVFFVPSNIRVHVTCVGRTLDRRRNSSDPHDVSLTPDHLRGASENDRCGNGNHDRRKPR